MGLCGKAVEAVVAKEVGIPGVGFGQPIQASGDIHRVELVQHVGGIGEKGFGVFPTAKELLVDFDMEGRDAADVPAASSSSSSCCLGGMLVWLLERRRAGRWSNLSSSISSSLVLGFEGRGSARRRRRKRRGGGRAGVTNIVPSINTLLLWIGSGSRWRHLFPRQAGATWGSSWWLLLLLLLLLVVVVVG